MTKNVGAKEICQDCGKVFITQKGFICPSCHRKRLSRYAKERGLGKIGNDAYSKMAYERKEKDE